MPRRYRGGQVTVTKESASGFYMGAGKTLASGAGAVTLGTWVVSVGSVNINS